MENFNYERFIDELVRNNVVADYSIRLYEDKLRMLPTYVTEEDKDEFLFDAARKNVTSQILSSIVTDFVQSVPTEYLQEYMEKYKFTTDLKEFFHPGRVAENGAAFGGKTYHENYCAQLIGYSNKIVNYGKKHEQVSNYFFQNNQQFQNQILPALKKLSVEDKKKLLDKMICTVGLSGMNIRGEFPYIDWEYVKMINGLSDEDKNRPDYRDMLASVGIDMGYMPKTFVSEICGNTPGRNR